MAAAKWSFRASIFNAWSYLQGAMAGLGFPPPAVGATIVGKSPSATSIIGRVPAAVSVAGTSNNHA